MTTHNEFSFTVMLLAGCLSYANSAVNPILYAFLSENFKKSFAKAFTCTSNVDVNAQLHGENSVFPQQHHLSKGKQSSTSRAETASTYLDSNPKKVKKKSKLQSGKSKLKESKKQITNLTTKINLKKHKRLSLDLSGQRLSHLNNEDGELNQANNSNYHIANSQAAKSTNKLKLIKLTPHQNNSKELALSSELDEHHRLNEPDQINKASNQEAVSSARFKRRRKSEPKLSTASAGNEAGQQQSKDRRRSTLISQVDLELSKQDDELSSDEDDLAYESEDDDEDYEDDSSVNSQQTNERNCVAMPARLKAKFLSVSGSRFRSLNRKATPIKRTNSSTSLEAIKTGGSAKDNRKISLVSSESSQLKKSNKNKLLILMNKLTNKQSDEMMKTSSEQTIEKRPENRISRKRISQAEAEHHRFGRIQLDKINSQLNSRTTSKSAYSHNVNKQDVDGERCVNASCLSNKPNNDTTTTTYDLEHRQRGSTGNSVQSSMDSENHQSSNDTNNNYDANSDGQFRRDETNCINSCTNSKSCESSECAQCSKCLERRGVIQTQL